MNMYDNIYKQGKNVFGNNPTPLLRKGVEFLAEKNNALDIGAGQGRDTLFLLELGFNVESIDTSRVAIEKLNEINNSVLVASQIALEDYAFRQNKYDLINAINVFQFVEKSKLAEIIPKLRNGLKSGGVVVIAAFTESDPTFIDFSKPRYKTYFANNELQKNFKDFDIKLYKEMLIDDSGHPGAPEPHQHGVVRLIAQKK
jgi:tellurite methyltransferase